MLYRVMPSPDVRYQTIVAYGQTYTGTPGDVFDVRIAWPHSRRQRLDAGQSVRPDVHAPGWPQRHRGEPARSGHGLFRHDLVQADRVRRRDLARSATGNAV